MGLVFLDDPNTILDDWGTICIQCEWIDVGLYLHGFDFEFGVGKK